MMTAQSVLRIVTLASLVAVGACATAANGGGGQGSNVLTQEQLAAAEATNLYDAINRLRPRWLTGRGGRSLSALSTEIVVFQNQSLLGGVEVLRQFNTDVAARVRYMDGATASASLPGLGSRHVEGAIIIETSARQ